MTRLFGVVLPAGADGRRRGVRGPSGRSRTDVAAFPNGGLPVATAGNGFETGRITNEHSLTLRWHAPTKGVSERHTAAVQRRQPSGERNHADAVTS